MIYTPDGNFNGNDSFTYTIIDGRGGTDLATVSVTVNSVEDDPIAVNDSAVTDEELPSIDVDVLGNDSDGDDDTLTITAVTQPMLGEWQAALWSITGLCDVHACRCWHLHV